MAVGSLGSATSKAMNFLWRYQLSSFIALRLMLNISKIVSIYMVSKKEYQNISTLNLLHYSEAMKMILSSESPDSEDLNDQG